MSGQNEQHEADFDECEAEASEAERTRIIYSIVDEKIADKR